MRYAETGVNLEIDLSRGNIEKVETDPRNMGNLQRTIIAGRVVTD
jgi:hypothetical protein